MALGGIYLIDKSAWEQRRHSAEAKQRLSQLAARRQLAVCVVTMAELLYSARNAQEIAQLRLDLHHLSYLDLGPDGEHSIPHTMQALAERGQHRVPIPDLLLAAAAYRHNAIVLHYDSDFERIAEVTGQAQEWIIPRGTGHGRDAA